MIYFGCFDGHVYVLNADTGKAVYAPLAASPEALPIKTAPSAASSKGVMAINCADRRLAGYNLASGAIAWSIPFNNTRLLGSPQLYQEVLYIFTSTGEIIAVAPENGEVQRRSSFDIQLGQPAVLGGDRAFLVNGTGTVQAVDLATLQRTWSYDCSESISGPPTVDSSFVVLPTISGKLICLSTEGQPLWVQNFGEAILAGGAVFRNTFFAGTVGGNVLCLDLWTGKLIWSFTPDNKPKEKQAGMLARGIVTGGKFFIGSENHTVYCLTLD
jgi:outer membrane protein assembly factor BamB